MRHHSFLLAPLVLAGACAELPDTTPVTADESAIINGDDFPSAESGHVIFGNTPTGVCSGTLLRNRWVLTAKHCFASNGDNPTGVIAEMEGQSTHVFTVTPHPTLDVSLVQLEYPLKMQGVTSGYEARLRTAPTTELAYGEVECFGYGYSLRRPDGTDDYAGELHHAVLPLFTAFESFFSVQFNERHQMVAKGDSGGGCFANGELAGVISKYDDPIARDGANIVSVPHVRTWIDQNLPALIAPFAPTDLSAVPFERGIYLRWSPVPRALRYRLTVQPDNTVASLIGDSESYYLDGLVQNTSHTFQLCAINGAGQACQTISARTQARAPVPMPGTDPAFNVKVKPLPLESNIVWPMQISWDDGDPIIAYAYEIERRMVYPSTVGAWKVATRVPTTTHRVVLRRPMTEFYQFRVCSVASVNRICSPVGTIIPANQIATPPGNLLGDGAFEAQMVVADYPDLLLPWRAEGQSVSVDCEGPSGQRIRLDAGDGARWRAVTQRVEVKPHTIYTLTAHVAHDRPVRGELGARTASGERRLMVGHFGEASDENLVKGVFDSGDETSVEIYLGFTSEGEREVLYLDDVSLDET